MHLGVSAKSADALVASMLGDGERVAVVDSPATYVGIKRFGPGEVFPNHFHEHYDEFFATLTGEIAIWQGRATRVTLRAGASLLVPRGAHHMLVNETAEPATLMFVKVPLVEDDTTWVEWTPEPEA